MKIFIRSAAAALALSLVGVSGAEAQIDFSSPTDPACDTWTVGPLGESPYAWNQGSNCWGAYVGNVGSENETVQNSVLAFLDANVGTGPWSFGGKTDADGGGAGPFEDFDNATAGDLEFDVTMYGEFVIALKTATYFNLYYFNEPTGLDGITFAGLDNALSNASVWTGDDFSVPEPGTMLLLGTGLLGMALARRREDEVEA